jgi:RNA polymerase sigma-70 factor (ECF subfamily)
VSAAFEQGRAAWPEVALDEERFARHLSTRGEVTALHVGDLYLACACAHGVPAALAAFDRAFLSQVGAFVARVDASAAFADEVKQVLREKLLVAADGEPKIAAYAGTGALAHWLRAVALRTALNLRRNQDDRPHQDYDDSVMEGALGGDSPELTYIRAHCHAEFRDAFRASLAELPLEERSVLRLHLGGGLTGEQIAACLHVHRATVVRRLASAHETLQRETLRRLREKLQLSAAELDSLIAMVRSRLDLSLQRILQQEG